MNQPLPGYLKLNTRQMEDKIRGLEELLKKCAICPHVCGANRVEGEKGSCQAPAEALVASYAPHFGEEPELVGRNGSGTIFFSHCNLACVFCQNWEISRGLEGKKVSPQALANIMLFLQERGCHNINLVTPTPFLYPILQGLNLARENGLKLPLVYNCGGYESAEVLKILENVIDIFMPDFKFYDKETAKRFCQASDYPEKAKSALKEMQRQVGDLVTNKQGIAYRGLLVRHLVLPENLANTAGVVRFLSEEISPNCAVNIMAQYYPAYEAANYPPLNRPISPQEYRRARRLAEEAGLRLLR